MAMRTVDAGKEAALVWFSQQTPFLILLSFLIPLLALIYYFMNVLVLPKFASSKIWRPTTVSFPTPVYDGLRLPLLGNALSLGRQGSKFLLHCHEKYGDAFSLNVFGQTMVFLCSPESIVYFFRAPGTCLSFTPAVQQFTHRVFELHPMDFLPRHRSMLLRLRHAISGEALPQHATTLAQLLVRQAHCVLFKPEDGNHGSSGISKTVELYSAIKEIFFPAAVSCLFGAKFLQRHGQRAVLDMFSKFEGAFERAASPLPHVFQIKFRESRAFLVEIFRQVHNPKRFIPQSFLFKELLIVLLMIVYVNLRFQAFYRLRRL